MRWFDGLGANSISSFRRAHLSIRLSVHHMQQGFSTFGFSIVHLYDRRGVCKGILGQILGDV